MYIYRDEPTSYEALFVIDKDKHSSVTSLKIHLNYWTKDSSVYCKGSWELSVSVKYQKNLGTRKCPLCLEWRDSGEAETKTKHGFSDLPC